MASKHARRRTSRTRSIESLEERRVMSADPLAPLLGGSIQHHAFADEPSELPALVHHAQRDADFWIDSWYERNLDTLLGDVEKTLSSAHGATGLTQIRNDYGFVGAGQTVAIIDSGIAYSHYALGSGFGADYRVVGGWDFTEENDANPYDDGPWGSHGTHVAGIVGADRSGTGDDGVAPGVDLVGLRVFNDAGDGYFSWVENALQWVHQNRNAFENPITAVNLSLGTSWNSTSVPSWANLEEEFAQLESDGIFITVSAGNSFASYNTTGLSYPAASPYVVPVMSVTDAGNLSSFSQRHPSAIAAPGQYIVSTVPDYVGNQNGADDDFASFSGTSMAAPYVAGASVIVREAMQFVGYANITQDAIFNHMMATATTFFDAATGLNYKRLNLEAAIDALMPSDDYGSTIAAAHNLGSVGVGGQDFSGLIGTLSDADYFQFTAAATGTVTLTATTTHGLVPQWNGAGTVSGSQGEVFTFDVVAGQSYNFGITTDNGIGYYDVSISLTAAPVTPPSVPGSFQIIANSPTQVELSWSDCLGETSYQIVRWSSETGTVVAATLGADVTSYTLNNLPAGSRQWFQMSARNSAGAATTQWQYVTMPTVPPNAPGALNVAVVSPTKVTLNWSDVTGETSYQISRWSAATGTVVVATVGANTTSYTVTNLPPSSRQFFVVTARNSAGTAATSWHLAEMPQATPPSAPATLQAAALGPSQVALNWAAANGAESYQIIHWSDQTGSTVAATVAANITSYVMSNAAPGTRHWFRVEACNILGKAGTSWQLAETPSVASATAAFVSGSFNSSVGFSVRESTASFAASLANSASRRYTVRVARAPQPAYATPALRVGSSTLDHADGRMEAFGKWQREDMHACWNSHDVGDALLDVLAESALAAERGEPDYAVVAAAWE